ncbi:MAG: prolyl oligopeptidase family serine peptidase [Dechloromonas sp.]|nr:MAG: prolyl oligopeptidase family serine peptidase [Dechloromonas sp.]
MVALIPFDHVRAGHPPTVISHGEADTTVPIRTSREHAAKAREHGAQCRVIAFTDEVHRFCRREPFEHSTIEQGKALLREQRLFK